MPKCSVCGQAVKSGLVADNACVKSMIAERLKLYDEVNDLKWKYSTALEKIEQLESGYKAISNIVEGDDD